MAQLIEWSIGQQLIGIIFLIAGVIQRYYPPQKINSLYGYRTERSMKDQQNWDEGNRYSAVLMIKASVILIVAGVILAWLLAQIDMGDDAKMLIRVALMILSAAITVVVMFRCTEKHLKSTFKDTTQ